MVIKHTIKITIPDEGIDVNGIEQATKEATERAGKEIFVEALKRVEERGLRKAAVVKQRSRSRWLLTEIGWILYERYVVYDPILKKHYCWLDRELGIERWQKSSSVTIERGVEFAVEHSYRKSAELFRIQTGGEVSHMKIWEMVQREGWRRREKQRDDKEKVFAQALEPERAPAAPGLVVGEMDGTMIRLQRGAGNVEVKCAAMYSRKEKTGKRRLRVVDKTVCAAMEPMDEFAERWWLMGEKKFRISEAPNLLLITDGLDIYREAVSGYFPGVVHQLDRWHLNERIHSVVQDVAAEKKVAQMLNEGRERDVLRFIRFHEFPGREEKAQELERYLENNIDSINGVRRLPKDPSTSSLRRVGSGVMEKTVGTLIAARFKGRGRSWSIEGASNLLQLRVEFSNSHYPLKGERKNSKTNPCNVGLN